MLKNINPKNDLLPKSVILTQNHNLSQNTSENLKLSNDWCYKSPFRKNDHFRVIGVIATYDSGVIITHVSGVKDSPCIDIKYKDKKKRSQEIPEYFVF